MSSLRLTICASLLTVVSATSCGGTIFDKTYMMCCKGVITPRPDPACVDSSNHKCCNTVGFDNSRFMCCYGSILPRPDGDTENHKCCQDDGGVTQVLNNKVNMCCNGVVTSRPGGDRIDHKCCGVNAFNRLDYSCNHGDIVPNGL